MSSPPHIQLPFLTYVKQEKLGAKCVISLGEGYSWVSPTVVQCLGFQSVRYLYILSGLWVVLGNGRDNIT